MRAAPDPRPTAAIVPGCAGATDRLICGLHRRERLEKTLAARGYRLVADPAAAGRVVQDCRVLCGDDEMHLCTEGVRAVQKRLLTSLRKSIDGVISRTINRPVSLALTRLLMNTRIKPNHVTTFIMLVGISSGFVAAQGGYWAGVIGALLLNAQSILDGTDGELARLRYQGSFFGQWYDTVSDDLSNLSFFIGVTIACQHEPLQWFGLAGIVAFVITEAVVYYALVTVYRSGNLQSFEWDLGGGTGKGFLSRFEFMVKRDFFCFAFAICALFGSIGLDVVVFSQAGAALFTLFMLARQLVRYGLTPPSRAQAPRALAPEQAGPPA